MDWSELRQRLLGDDHATVLPPSIKLPMLPRAVTEFSRRSADPEATPKELGAIIESDAGLTCELLKYVNSAASGVRRTVSSPSNAIGLLGVRAVRLLVATTAVRDAMSSRQSKLINFQTFWNTNLERALFARETARVINADPDLAFAGGLLQDFLLPVLTAEMLADYVRFAEGQDAAPVELTKFEQNAFGWTHAEAAAHIMCSWGLPDDLVCCVALHHRGLGILADKELRTTAAAAVAVSGLMPDPFQQSPLGLEQLVKLDAAWPCFCLDDIVHRVDEEFRAVAPASAAHHISFLRRYESTLERAD